MKQLHYVLTAKHLTGDSEIKFFNNRSDADKFFKLQTEPLLKVCMANDLVEDEAFSFGITKDIVRFDSGYDEELDSLLNECNHYFIVNTVEVKDDITHYVASLSEWVDESYIEFYNEVEAKESWNNLIEGELRTAAQYHNLIINRNNEDTWSQKLSAPHFDKEGATLYDETHFNGVSDAYFGFSSDYTWTYRLGKIEF
jgi:hypothetical protein